MNIKVKNLRTGEEIETDCRDSYSCRDRLERTGRINFLASHSRPICKLCLKSGDYILITQGDDRVYAKMRGYWEPTGVPEPLLTVIKLSNFEYLEMEGYLASLGRRRP